MPLSCHVLLHIPQRRRKSRFEFSSSRATCPAGPTKKAEAFLLFHSHAACVICRSVGRAMHEHPHPLRGLRTPFTRRAATHTPVPTARKERRRAPCLAQAEGQREDNTAAYHNHKGGARETAEPLCANKEKKNIPNTGATQHHRSFDAPPPVLSCPRTRKFFLAECLRRVPPTAEKKTLTRGGHRQRVHARPRPCPALYMTAGSLSRNHHFSSAESIHTARLRLIDSPLP